MSSSTEDFTVKGHYVVECLDKDGNLKWTDEIDNVVATIGKNLTLDTLLKGSAYTTVGPFMGLISLSSYSAIVSGDTMGSHTGWVEAGSANPATISNKRQSLVLSSTSAGVIQTSSAASFSVTSSGVIKGAFVVTGAGAVSTQDNTSGTLLSAGLFTGGDKTVANADTINVTWSLTLT
jgi:hypothetical protein